MGRLFPALWPLVGVLSFALLVACGTVEAVQEGSPQEDALISIYAPQPDQTLKPIQEESVASLLDLAVGGELPVDAPSAFNVSQIASIPLAGQSKATNLNTLARTVVSQQASLAQQAEGAVPAQPKSVVFAQAAPQPVPVPAPAKMSGATKIANEGDDVPFEGAFNDAGVLDTHSIRWNFGDGTEKLNVLDPTHVYKDNGTYKVTLDVTDKDGDVGSANIDVVVNNLPPSAGLGPAKLVAEGVLTTFNSAVTDPGAADTHSFLWDFGAGGQPVDGGSQVTHNYPDEGTFTVTVTVTDDDGGSTEVQTTVHVLNEPPAVNAGSDQTSDEGGVVQFAGTFLDPGSLDTHSISWNFGDGTVSTGDLAPTHVYQDDGTFSVTLTVTDNDGGSGTDKMSVKVLNKAPVVQITP